MHEWRRDAKRRRGGAGCAKNRKKQGPKTSQNNKPLGSMQPAYHWSNYSIRGRISKYRASTRKRPEAGPIFQIEKPPAYGFFLKEKAELHLR
jgi:hypothetical protein